MEVFSHGEFAFVSYISSVVSFEGKIYDLSLGRERWGGLGGGEGGKTWFSGGIKGESVDFYIL